jgi:hypothetical protein
MKTAILLMLIPAALCAQDIEGNIYDSLTGLPIAGATVRASESAAHSDGVGHFRVSDLPSSDTLLLFIRRAGYLSASRRVDRKAESVSDLRIKLMPGAVITGTVTDEDGLPVAGAYLVAMRYRMVNGRRKLEHSSAARSDDRGEYRIINLHAGRYYIHSSTGALANWDRHYSPQFYPAGITPSTDGLIELKAGEEHGGVNLRFAKCECATVEGRLVLADDGVAPSLRPAVYLAGGDPEYQLSGKTSAGAFKIPHVPAGTYTLRAGRYPPKAGDLFGQQSIKVGDGGTLNVSLNVREVEPVDVSGTVLLEDGRAPQSMTISAHQLPNKSVTAQSNDDGSFTLEGLLPGHYSLQVKSASAHAISARMGDEEILEAGFDVDGPLEAQLAITVSNRTYLIQGKLSDPAANPVAHAYIRLDSGRPGGVTIISTDAEGVFRTHLRRTGQYRIYVAGEDQADVLGDPDFLAEHANDFPPVTVIEGANPPLTLHWQPQ